MEHALSCLKGGFPSIRHNEIRDLTANLLTEVCSDDCIEPELQPITGEVLTGATSNAQDLLLHPTSPFCNWWYGKGSHSFLQKACTSYVAVKCDYPYSFTCPGCAGA